ncbi:hypothetical protein CK203_090724 [Vitis vinifera]|uniref:Uncharacterized protein n=1 Tax=Vitis vinifera TaxID=29760 RepID=A0A438CJZ6_VITVI|nr:hypothetical protein CK203_090724 [Vitis vinifera]
MLGLGKKKKNRGKLGWIIFVSMVLGLLLITSICFVLASDPEEMRRAQEEMRNQGVPSLSSLLPGAGRAN